MRDGALGRPAPPARPSDCGRGPPEPRSLAELSVAYNTPTGLGAQLRSGRDARQERTVRPSGRASGRPGGARPFPRYSREKVRGRNRAKRGRGERAARERRAARRLRIRRRGLLACRRGGGIGAKRPRRMVILPARYGRFTASLSAAETPPAAAGRLPASLRTVADPTAGAAGVPERRRDRREA
jgi:hypothetical protein